MYLRNALVKKEGESKPERNAASPTLLGSRFSSLYRKKRRLSRAQGNPLLGCVPRFQKGELP